MFLLSQGVSKIPKGVDIAEFSFQARHFFVGVPGYVKKK